MVRKKLKNPADTYWADPNQVGLDNCVISGKKTVDGVRSLNAFKDFINSRQFPFPFDQAIGFLNYFITVGNTCSISLTGLSFQNGICLLDKVSILTDQGFFQNLPDTTHQLAHSLGATEDGSGTALACPITSNFIMAPFWNFQLASITNINKFSSCSVNDIKTLLLNFDFRLVFKL